MPAGSLPVFRLANSIFAYVAGPADVRIRSHKTQIPSASRHDVPVYGRGFTFRVQGNHCLLHKKLRCRLRTTGMELAVEAQERSIEPLLSEQFIAKRRIELKFLEVPNSILRLIPFAEALSRDVGLVVDCLNIQRSGCLSQEQKFMQPHSCG